MRGKASTAVQMTNSIHASVKQIENGYLRSGKDNWGVIALLCVIDLLRKYPALEVQGF